MGERGEGLERRADERARPPNFAAAAQKRYSGTFVNADGVTLPRVSLWMAWNEPNNPVFLRPQYRRTGTTWTIQSGRDYAKLCNAIVQGIKSVQRPPRSRAARPPPREQQPELEPPVGLAARVPARDEGGRRERLRRLRTPPVYGSPAETPSDEAAARAARAAADRGHAGEHRRAHHRADRLYGKKMRIWITEYGYQTNPPDTIFGVTWSKQAPYLTQAVAIARANPRIDMFLWFLLRDEQRLAGWQSGLVTFDGKRKPSFDAFRRAAASLTAP